MISKELTEFLSNPALVFLIGTRDEKLQPSVGRGCGVTINKDNQSINVLIPASVVEPHIANLKNNGRMAFTAIFPAKHSSYQIKGTYEKHQAATDADYKMMENNNVAFKELLAMFFGPASPGLYSSNVWNPAVSITIKTEDIFNQTPGVGAGKKIN